jgi:16S rRNA (guanine527-N7)-methyltransferase
VQELSTTGVEWGLIGPRENSVLWERHIFNCAAISETIPQNASVIDIGSGAGLPGLVLAIERPDIKMSLIEPLERRVEWLNKTITLLKLKNVTVKRGKAQAFHDTLRADIVTARAVTHLKNLVPWALPLCAEDGGKIIALKGQKAQIEIEEASKELKNCTAQVLSYGNGILGQPTTVVEVVPH